MSKKLSEREVIALVSQTDIEPTDALVSEIREILMRFIKALFYGRRLVL